LISLISVKFSNAIIIAYGHYIKNTIKCRTNAFTAFIPNFKEFLTLAVHYHTASISKQSLDEKIFVQKGDLFNHIA
jgi:hypothetical protein